jgi:hypothetical protein
MIIMFGSVRASTAARILPHELAPRNDLVPGQVAAALRGDLVLDVQRRHAGRLVHLHGAPDVQRVAVAGVRVGDQRDVEDRGQVARMVGHLAEPGESEIGETEPRRRRAVAGHVHGGESGVLNEPRRNPVVGARDDEPFLLGHERAKRGPAIRHARPPRSARAIRRSSAGCE